MIPPADDRDRESDFDDGEALWRHVAATVRPLPGRRSRERARPAPSTLPAVGAPRHAGPGQAMRPGGPGANLGLGPNATPNPDHNHGSGHDLDRRTADRLRRGLLPIDGRLDLHGMTQDAAHRRLLDFIRRGHAGGRRCLLVITGKGGDTATAQAWYERPKGVLRARLPEWLAASDLAPMILRIQPAQPRHGGAGAFYVLLRRQRG